MRKQFPEHVEAARIRSGVHASPPRASFGAFKLRLSAPVGEIVVIVVDNGERTGWEHVSASFADRCPSWSEMCRIKDLFFEPHETVMQLHVPKDQHINTFPHCLHLWRPLRAAIPLPPRALV